MRLRKIGWWVGTLSVLLLVGSVFGGHKWPAYTGAFPVAGVLISFAGLFASAMLLMISYGKHKV